MSVSAALCVVAWVLACVEVVIIFGLKGVTDRLDTLITLLRAKP